MTLQLLFAKYLDDTISPEELSRLYAMIREGYDEEALDEILKGAYVDPGLAGSDGDRDKKEVFASLLEKIESKEGGVVPPAPVVSLYRRRWMAVGAAVLMFLLAGGVYRYYSAGTRGESEGGKRLVRLDVPPGRSGAILTLGNGRLVQLDSIQNGLLEQADGVQARKEGGQLSYEGDAGTSGAVVSYNTITTPRGRQFRLRLADGTGVLLNAASSIRYPTVFSGDERRVEVSGEAYFEVAHSTSSPFVVELSRAEIKVLGTHFDVADYSDEDNINATLVEGSIKLISRDEEIRLRPGEQGRITRAGGKLSLQPVDTSAATAWIRGRLDIGNSDLAGLMRQISRWYDVDVIFQGKVPSVRIGGIIHRDVNLSTVLDFLEENGVRYTTKGKTILISP